MTVFPEAPGVGADDGFGVRPAVGSHRDLIRLATVVQDIDGTARSCAVRRAGQDLLRDVVPAVGAGVASDAGHPAAHIPIPSDLGDHTLTRTSLLRIHPR